MPSNINSYAEITRLVKEENLSLLPEPCKGIAWSKIEGKTDCLTLFDQMDSNNTDIVCIICGARSGNLVCLDIDVKYKRGFDVSFFDAIKNSEYRDLFASMRLERTPSGGYHFFYKICEIGNNEIPRSEKIASRPATEEELSNNKTLKKYCFLETRGEGGICKTNPSPNYRLLNRGIISGSLLDGSLEEGIPTITYNEHCSIIEFCKLFDECPEEKNIKIKVERDIVERYQIGCNPYESFNNSELGANVLCDYADWVLSKKSGEYLLFKKKGRKDYDIGATFNKTLKFFCIHTSNTEFAHKIYSPSNLLCYLQYGGDKGELGRWLEVSGFGKLRRSVEKRIITRNARQKLPPPENASEEGKKEYDEELKKFELKYPHGTFWEEDEKGNISISQQGIDNVLVGMEFKYYNNKIYQIQDGGYLLKHITEGELFHCLLLYIGENWEGRNKVYDAYSKHIKTYGDLTISRLIEFCKLPHERIMESDSSISYKFYNNCYLSISSNEINEIDYSQIGDKYILQESVLNRNYKKPDGNYKDSMYWKYLEYAITGGMSDYVHKIIGYLTHDFLNDSMNSIIVATASNPDPKKGSGSGKNLFFNILNHATTVHVIDGAQVELKNSLLQSYNFERVLVISDVVQHFNYSFFKNFSSGASSLKKLYQDVVVLKRSQMPKPVILTNYSYVDDAGLGRRIIPIEFSEFFSKFVQNGFRGIRGYFGCMFPSYDKLGEWDEFNWNAFDYIIAISIQMFLSSGELMPQELSDGGWEKQFVQTYKEDTFNFIEQNIEKWCSENLGRVETSAFDKCYNDYCNYNNIRETYRKKSATLNKAIDDYCNYKKIKFEKNKNWTIGGIPTKGRIFGNLFVEEKVPF